MILEKKLCLKHKLIFLVSIFFLVNFISAGAAFAVTSNVTSNVTNQSVNDTNVTVSNSTYVTNTTVNVQTADFSEIKGYFINPSATPLSTVDPSVLKNMGVTDVFISVSRSNPSILTSFLDKFNGSGINVYAWVTCFKDSQGNWINPNNSTLMKPIIDDIISIAANYNVSGIMLDCVRYPGTAYKYTNATLYVDSFVASIRDGINIINNKHTAGKPYILLSAALMPEGSVNGYYYGQDYNDLSEYLDFLSPMIYKGNYMEPSSWIGSTIAYIKSQANGVPVVAILQTYYSDSNAKPLTSSELTGDILTAVNNGSYGYSLFRYGLIASNYTGYNLTPDTTAAVIVFTYNNPIKLGSGLIEFSMSDGTPVPFTSSINGNVLTITPSILLVSNELYTLILHTGYVNDVEGYPLALSNLSFSVDATPPIVKSIDPVNNSITRDTKKVIKFTFSEPIKLGNNSIELYNSNGTPVSFKSSISGNVLTITPLNSYTNSKYTIILHSGCITDLIGNPLALFSSSFSVDTTPPTVGSIDPVNGSIINASKKIIKVTFSESIKYGNSNIELHNSNGTSVPFTSSISGKVLTITPLNSYTNGKYTVTLHTGSITDLAGNPLAVISSKFVVDTIPPKISSSNPMSNAVNVGLTTPVTIKFSENIKAGNLSGIYIKNLSTGVIVHLSSVSISGNVLTIKMASSRLHKNQYLVYIPAGAVKDLAGNNLTAAYSFKFKTK